MRVDQPAGGAPFSQPMAFAAGKGLALSRPSPSGCVLLLDTDRQAPVYLGGMLEHLEVDGRDKPGHDE